MRFQTPTTSVASMPRTSVRSVVLMSAATAPGARPACDSPYPMIPDSVFTRTMTASRFTARPIPRRTLLSLGSGNDVGIAVISAILSAASNFGKGEFIARFTSECRYYQFLLVNHLRLQVRDHTARELRIFTLPGDRADVAIIP